MDKWTGDHPQEMANLEQLYSVSLSAKDHDLRGRPEAARWVRDFPVDFSQQNIVLSASQVRSLTPSKHDEAARVPGPFERIFVDRDNQRLFLTSTEVGLVSLSIAKRYAFELEGGSDRSGARDFFIYDSKTAFVEERAATGYNRDLVVLDISDRAAPREVARLKGALPDAGGGGYYHGAAPSQLPTFEQYAQIREGRMSAPTWCQPPAPPQYPRHPGNCRGGRCQNQDFEQDDVARRRGPMPSQSRAVAENAPRSMADMSSGGQQKKSVAPSPKAGMPQGGSGGAGSLSQMMVFGSTLYVLSGTAGASAGLLTTFDVSAPRHPRISHIIRLNNGPEALQRHDNLLLVAGRDAVVTASLGVASQPRLLGEFRQDCPVNYDPVVMQGSIAYRTIIIDNPRNRCTSRLEVIDLSQAHQPVLRTTYPIARPRGLAVLGERLFVADEANGVRVFDITDPVTPTLAATWHVRGVKDLVLSDFDLYAMSSTEVQTFFVGPLYQRGAIAEQVAPRIEAHVTVISGQPTPKRSRVTPLRTRAIAHAGMTIIPFDEEVVAISLNAPHAKEIDVIRGAMTTFGARELEPIGTMPSGTWLYFALQGTRQQRRDVTLNLEKMLQPIASLTGVFEVLGQHERPQNMYLDACSPGDCTTDIRPVLLTNEIAINLARGVGLGTLTRLNQRYELDIVHHHTFSHEHRTVLTSTTRTNRELFLLANALRSEPGVAHVGLNILARRQS
ncbi:MAG: hypothetical protein H0U74_05205 [Bradymonadaceae bacterium]|nr:hypothetical protein [Lujinxingiaceae bacterium]